MLVYNQYLLNASTLEVRVLKSVAHHFFLTNYSYYITRVRRDNDECKLLLVGATAHDLGVKHSAWNPSEHCP